MRKINKGDPPPSFSSLLSSRKKPSNWDEFHKNNHDIFNECREMILINEQDCLCGYTELPIQKISDCHIDHYRKKSLYPIFCFEWNNFIVATKNSDFGACFKDQYYCSCIADYLKILNPIMDNCIDFFEYDGFGKIKPKSNLSLTDISKAEETIEAFNLNHKSLSTRRQDIILIIDSYLQGGLPNCEIKKAISSQGFKSLLEQYLT